MKSSSAAASRDTNSWRAAAPAGGRAAAIDQQARRAAARVRCVPRAGAFVSICHVRVRVPYQTTSTPGGYDTAVRGGTKHPRSPRAAKHIHAACACDLQGDDAGETAG